MAAMLSMLLVACGTHPPSNSIPDIYEIGESQPKTQEPDVIQLPTPPSVNQAPVDDALYGTAAESLLASATGARKEGRSQAASLYLERAIRIAPGSSWLYKEMAELRLDEGDAGGAEGFVHHALRNAPNDNESYRAALWSLLATCLTRQGKQEKAGAAEAKAKSLGGYN